MPISSGYRGKKAFKPFSSDGLALTEISAVWAYIPLLLYPAGLTREWQWALGAGVLAVNGAVYGLLLVRRARRARFPERRA